MIIIYLTTITGFSFEMLLEKSNSAELRKNIIKKTGVFVASFTIVFSIIGGFAGSIGGALGSFFDIMSIIAGILFVFLGLHYLGMLKTIFWRLGGMMDGGEIESAAKKWREKDGSLSTFGIFVIGTLFALVCSHCISPTLVPALALAASEADFGGGALVMLAFSLGLGSAFMITALFFSQAMERLRWIKRHERTVHIIVGVIFLFFGLLLILGQYLSLISLLYRIIPWRSGM